MAVVYKIQEIIKTVHTLNELRPQLDELQRAFDTIKSLTPKLANMRTALDSARSLEPQLRTLEEDMRRLASESTRMEEAMRVASKVKTDLAA